MQLERYEKLMTIVTAIIAIETENISAELSNDPERILTMLDKADDFNRDVMDRVTKVLNAHLTPELTEAIVRFAAETLQGRYMKNCMNKGVVGHPGLIDSHRRNKAELEADLGIAPVVAHA